jgi:hypothetical protein
VQIGNDLSPDIGVNKFFGNFKILSKDIQFPITPDEADERDCSFGDVVQVGKLEFRRRKDRNKLFFLYGLERSFALKVAIAVVFIMEELKVLRLGAEIPIAPEPLGSKEATIIGVIEAFHGTIPPRFSDGDKDDFDPEGKTETKDDAKRTGIPIAAPKAKFVVDLKEVGNAHGFPATDQALGDGSVVFAPLGMDKDPVAVNVHHLEGIEAAVVFDIPRPQKVGLMDVVAPQRFPEIGVFHSFGLVRSFF